MKTRALENWGTKETLNFLSLSNEALRVENLRLMSEIDRLISNIEICDAREVSNLIVGHYETNNNFTYTFKNR